MSNVSRGSHYRRRTADYFTARGYHVAVLERMFWGGGFATKADQLGADLLIDNGHETVYVQVKGGEHPKAQVAAAVREFRRFTVAGGQLIVCWQKGAREPEIIDAKTYEIRGESAHEPAPMPTAKPKKPKGAHFAAEYETDGPLF